MSTITKELAKLFRKITNSEIDAEGNAHVVLSPADSLLINNARIALASLEAEAVACIDQANLDYLESGDATVWPATSADAGDVLLYSAPQPLTTSERAELENYRNAQQVVPVNADDNFYSWFGREWHEHYQHNQYTTAAKQMLGVMAESAWKAGRRAAMLKGGNHTEQHLDMVNSPVIPDGWVACSERMPDVGNVVLTAKDGVVNVGEMERSGANYRYFTSIASGRELPATHWQPLPAAPQQEVKP